MSPPPAPMNEDKTPPTTGRLLGGEESAADGGTMACGSRQVPPRGEGVHAPVSGDLGRAKTGSLAILQTVAAEAGPSPT
jgi:hypothetical protein